MKTSGSGRHLRLQAPLVERVTLENVVLQDAGRPDSEFGSSARIDAISNGDDGIQTVIKYGFVRTGNVHFLHIAFSLQLSCLEDVLQMFCDHGSLGGKQGSHFLLRQPERILLQTHVHGCPAIPGTVEDNLPPGPFDFRLLFHCSNPGSWRNYQDGS